MTALSHLHRLLACLFFAQAINWASTDGGLGNAAVTFATGVAVYALAERTRP